MKRVFRLFLGILLGTGAVLLYGTETWSLGQINGTTQLLHNGQAVYPYILSIGIVVSPQQKMTGRSQVLRAVAHGKTNVYMICIPCLWGDSTEKRTEKYIADQFDYVLSVDPHAYFIPRMATHQYDFIPDFLRVSTADKNLSANGSREHPSYASKKFQEESAKAIRRTVRFLENRYGDHMMGYMPGAGQHSEFQYIDYNVKGNFLGYDPSTREAFRTFLKKKYGTDEALSKAWRRRVTIDRVLVPGPTRRAGAPGQQFYYPERNQDVIDFHEYINLEMADTLIRLCEAVRSEVGRTRITAAFYGYCYEILPIGNGPAQVGHYAFKRVLSSSAVDVICGPFSYWNISRCPGKPATCHTVGDTLQLNGKLWLNEDDSQTPSSIKRRAFSDATLRTNKERSREEATQILRRNLSFCFARNYGVWWHDLMACGRWDDDLYWVEKQRFEQLFAAVPPSPYRPDVVMTFGEEFVPFVVGNANAVVALGELTKMRASVGDSGCAAGHLLLSTLLKNDPPSKLDIHTTAVALTREERAALKKRAEKVPTVWMWRPGCLDLTTQQCSTKFTEELTGFQVEEVHLGNLGIAATPDGLDFGMYDLLINRQVNLVCYSPVPQQGDVVLAVWYYNSKKPAIVLRPGKEGKAFSVFCGAPWINPDVVRHLARKAGAHIYSGRNASVDIRDGFAALTVAEEGVYALNVGGTKRWFDFVTGKEAGRGPELILHSPKNHTNLLIDETVKAKLDGKEK